MIELLSEAFSFISAPITKEIIKKELRIFWRSRTNNVRTTEVAAMRASQLESTLSLVLNSDPVLDIIIENLNEQQEATVLQQEESVENDKARLLAEMNRLVYGN
ncbi:hypothetical protein EDC94DRAFT_648400 [Helicostylum pulchrum]|nr:hypothetical protein EDC94DRAFT_648400 [Helicostylum pulchrum]